MTVFEKLKNLIGELTGQTDDGSKTTKFDPTDRDLCSAALMFHVIMADGVVRLEESERLHSVLTSHYGLSEEEANALIEDARQADAEAVDLYSFTSALKRSLDKTERIALVEDLWEMVYADGELHEFEDNVVWRVAEMLAVDARDRNEMKRRVKARVSAS